MPPTPRMHCKRRLWSQFRSRRRSTRPSRWRHGSQAFWRGIHRGLLALRKLLPASLAVSLIALFSERGLAAVRASVMKASVMKAIAVEAATLTATSVAVTIGGVAMKKVLLAVVAIAALCFVWWAALPPELDAPSESPANDAQAAVATGDSQEPAANGAGAAPADSVEAARDQVADVPGGVRVIVRADQVEHVDRMVQEVSASNGSGVVLSGVLIELWAGKLERGPIDGQLFGTNTNAAGIAEFTGLAPGEYRLVAMAGDRRLGGTRRVVVASETVQDVEVHLALGGTIRGRVVDQRGTAVASATIWVGNRLSFVGSAERCLRIGAVSGEDGTFVLHHVRREDYVAARKVGYGASWSHPLQQLGDGAVALVLGSEAGMISGEVVDQNGKPLASVPVAIEPIQDRLRRALDGTLLGPGLGVVVRTSSAGTFSVDGLSPDAYCVQAWRMPYAPAKSQPTVAAGGHQRVQLTMLRRAAVYGYLRDSQGKAVPGVYVMRGGQGVGSQTAVTNPDGSYRFEGVNFQPFTLSAVRIASGARVEKPCPAPTGMETRVDLVLDEDPPIVGHARTASGRAVAGWHVTRTRADGGFKIWGLPSGAHRVRLHRVEADAAEPDLMVVGSADKPVEFVVSDDLLPRSSISGRVIDQDGKPIANAWATLPNSPVFEDPERNVDGRFSFAELDSGAHQLRISADGYVDLHRRIDLKSGQKRELGDLVLPRGATLRVRYQRPDGRPWQARPPVPWLRGKDGQVLLSGQIDYAIDGDAVVVTRIPPGTYDVFAPFGDELLIETQTVTLPGGEIRHLDLAVQVGRRRTLTFAVDKERKLNVIVRRGDGLVVLDRKINREDNRMQLSAVLPIGTFRVDASSDGGSHFAGDIRITKHVADAEPIVIARTK